jgi:hypothetical protein
MKKTFASIFFLVAVLFSTAEITYAQYVVECPLCSKLGTQLPEFAQQIITAGASLQTQLNTTGTFIKTVIQGPLQDALTAIAIAKSVNNIKNLIQGGLGNAQLIKTSPSIYIGNKEKGAVAVNLNTINGANGAYSNSILNTITGIYKNNDLTTQLSSFSVSSLPSLIQKNACTDAALTQRARQDSTSFDGTVDTDAFNARKTELYNTLCVGDPAKDPKLAQVLTVANDQDSSLCGTECFLRKINGDNSYAKGQRAAILIAKDAEEKKQAAAEDLKSGGGIASQTICPSGKRATTDAQGKPYANADQAPCTVPETVLTPSSVLSDSYKKAISSGDDTLKSTFGTGGISALLSSILGGINTFSKALNGGISFNIDSSTLNEGGTGDTASTQDLADNGAAKSTLTSPILKQLNSHAASLTNLSTIDSNYLAALDAYLGQLEDVKNCYDSLSTSTSSPPDARTAAYMSFYTNKRAALDGARSTIATEQSLIGTTRNLISTTISKLTASNSSQDISSIFNDYQNQVDTQNLPTQITGPQRGGDYQTFVGTAAQDTATGGAITTFRATCQNTRTQ